MSAQNDEDLSQNGQPRRNEVHDAQHTTSEHRHSQAFDSLKELTQHLDRLQHLSMTLSLLQLDDISWSCIQRLRNHDGTAFVLRTSLSQLYQIPDDMMQHIGNLRLGDDWERLKEFYFRTIATGVISARSTPSSRASASSTGKRSTASTGTSSSIMSWASSDTCISATLPAVPEVGEEIFIDKDDTPNTLEAIAEEAPMPPPKVKTRQILCPLPGCDMKYVKKGHFENHMRLAHGKLRTQSDQPRPQPRVNSSIRAVHGSAGSIEAHTETLVPLSMMTVRPTRNSSFSEMHTPKQTTADAWPSFQTPSNYEHHSGAPLRPTALSVTNVHSVASTASDQLDPLDFNMSMTDLDYEPSPTSAQTSAAVVEHMTPYDTTTERYGKLFYREYRAEDMSRSYSQT